MTAPEPSAELLAVASESPPITQPDRLEKIRTKMARVRDLQLQVKDMAEKMKEANSEINELTFKELPEMFLEAGMLAHTLEAKGNLPPVDAEVKPYFRANIAADWEPEARDRGFKTLEGLGAESLIKATITVELPRGEVAKARKLMAWLEKAHIPFTCGLAVNWNTLTAWLKERYTKKLGELTPGQLEAIGGRVATVVEVKVRKS